MDDDFGAAGIQNCSNICLDSKDPDYQVYNMIVSGTVLPFIGLVGLIGNTFVVAVYLNAEQRRHSTSIYLGALGVSDFLMICNAMFLFVLEAWRHNGPKSLAIWYGKTAPISFPMAAIFQTTSVYFCVGAAIDAFVSVVLPKVVSEIFCTPAKAKSFVLTISISSVIYNIPHFFEIYALDCFDHDGAFSLQICPTSFRQNTLYYTIYYTYMYTVIMAVGPLALLIILNIFVVCQVVRSPKDPDSDIVSLILVVCLFIFCNFMALLVNFLELTLYDQLQDFIVYLVDLSNLLVVINCTANFFVYCSFGRSFRRGLRKLLRGECSMFGPLETKGGGDPSTALSVITTPSKSGGSSLKKKTMGGQVKFASVLRHHRDSETVEQLLVRHHNGDQKLLLLAQNGDANRNGNNVMVLNGRGLLTATTTTLAPAGSSSAPLPIRNASATSI